MPADAADKTNVPRGSLRVAARMTLAAVPYLAWKAVVAFFAGSLDGAMLSILMLLSLLAVLVLFSAGLVISRAGSHSIEAPAGKLAIVATTWFLIGFSVDILLGMAAASYLSEVAASLGDSQVGNFWTDINMREALQFTAFSLGGGIAGVAAVLIYRARGTKKL